MKTTRYGFCLADLLLTISIIAILAAILFPVFARSRESARTSSCMNNLINIALALRTYANDNDMRYPPNDNDPSPLLPVYTTQRSFLCPSTGGCYRFGTIPGVVRKETQQTEKSAIPSPEGWIGDPGIPAPPQPDPSREYNAPEDGPGTSYFYVAGYRHDMLMHRMPLAGDMQMLHNNYTGNVLYTDGGIQLMNADDYRHAGLTHYAWTEKGGQQ